MDAVIPDDGESFFTFHEAMGYTPEDKPVNGFLGVFDGKINFNKPPPSEVPQPWKSVTEPVSFKNPAAKNLPTTLVFFLDKEQRPEVLEKDDQDSAGDEAERSVEKRWYRPE